MKQLTTEYQIRAEPPTSPIIRAISHVGVVAVTAVAKTLAKKHDRLWLGQGHDEAEEDGAMT